MKQISILMSTCGGSLLKKQDGKETGWFCVIPSQSTWRWIPYLSRKISSGSHDNDIQHHPAILNKKNHETIA